MASSRVTNESVEAIHGMVFTHIHHINWIDPRWPVLLGGTLIWNYRCAKSYDKHITTTIWNNVMICVKWQLLNIRFSQQSHVCIHKVKSFLIWVCMWTQGPVLYKQGRMENKYGGTMMRCHTKIYHIHITHFIYTCVTYMNRSAPWNGKTSWPLRPSKYCNRRLTGNSRLAWTQHAKSIKILALAFVASLKVSPNIVNMVNTC